MLQTDPIIASESPRASVTIAKLHSNVSSATASSVGNQTSNIVPSLHSLPRELRDLVYHQLWQNTPRLFLQTPFRLLYRPLDRDSYCSFNHMARSHDGRLIQVDTHGLPLWLLTSKAMLSEGLSQLFRHGIWQWSAHIRN
ncbi:hypothetical protein IQ06DRAFT_2203 [Phaeosphaeriaceae sp. SRC1lsM3a]|nr:hypothetical protein IQ06DRAFT_2203 [Stagonospora sp. SRC1lsM3a]